MTSQIKTMERAYYVVTQDSDKDDDVTSSCHAGNDDAINKCSSANPDAVSFRLLRSYRTGRRRRAKGAITSKIEHAIKLKTSPVRLAQPLQPH